MTRRYLLEIKEINWPTKPVKVNEAELIKAFSKPSEFTAFLNKVMERAEKEQKKIKEVSYASYQNEQHSNSR